ncbi:MAG: hypothetical protein JWP87_5302 [Labilithrix sp.]|nr:hypothetical protein [Labilithrix sp.]
MRASRARRIATLVATLLTLAVAHAGCGSDAKELFTRPFDAGADADATDERPPDVDETLGGPCTEDAQCDDKVPCTFDSCDKTLLRCRNVPDDTLCDDQDYCNGREKCVIRLGCAPGPVVTCQDDNPCTTDRCVNATKACEHAQRDLDGDGDPDNHCVGMRDCDDLDPDVGSNHLEVCGNGKDDDCDGIPDEAACTEPANDTCTSAFVVPGSGTYFLSTDAAKRDYPQTNCPSTVETPTASKDVVMKITVPPGAAQDVEVWATAQSSKNEVAVELRGTTPDSATSCTSKDALLGCGHIKGSPSARAIARGASAGSIVYAIVTTQLAGAVDVKINLHDAVPKPANESCGSTPEGVAIDAPVTVRLIDAAKDVASTCTKALTGELVYSFTLAADADVQIFASTLEGGGQPVVSLRDATCTGELQCRSAAVPPLFARNLSAGQHLFTVAGTRQIDASVLVKTYPVSQALPNESCATATAIVPNAPPIPVDLSKHEAFVKNGCLPGGPSAAYKLDLDVESDVLVIGRFPTNEQGSVSLSRPGCGTADLVVPPGCATGQTPQRVSARKVPAGSYRVIVADELGQTAQLSVLVRPSVPPTSVGASDSCIAPFSLPASGGFFIGDTTNATADFNAGCDAPGQPINGAKDQIMKLVLPQKQRVVLDMVGSSYSTILDVRQGPTCAGTEVPNACYVGFNASRSFLDLTLNAGTYWVQVDGYNGDRGAWNLDMRTLPAP